MYGQLLPDTAIPAAWRPYFPPLMDATGPINRTLTLERINQGGLEIETLLAEIRQLPNAVFVFIDGYHTVAPRQLHPVMEGFLRNAVARANTLAALRMA